MHQAPLHLVSLRSTALASSLALERPTAPSVHAAAAPTNADPQDSFAHLGGLESGVGSATPRAPTAQLERPLQLRGGALDLGDTAACCMASGATLLAWAGGVLGFALPLAVGIENLVASPSTFNPTGQQNLPLGITMVVLSATVFPTVGAVGGVLVGAALCGGPILCLNRA